MSEAKQPTIVMMAGLPGTGKSTLALAVTQRLGWPILDKDVVNGVLLSAGLEQAQAGPLAYDLTLSMAEDLVVRQCCSVIVDTAGRHPLILERLHHIARRAPAELKIIRCVAPAALRAERLANREPLPSQWVSDQATDEEQAIWYAHLPDRTLAVLTDQAPAVLLPTIIAYLQTSGGNI